MRQEQFVSQHNEVWHQLSEWLRLNSLNTKDRHASIQTNKLDWYADFDFPSTYRQVCQHLALAKSRQYSQPLLDKIGNLVLAGHQQFYRPKTNLKEKFFSLLLVKLPQTIRQEWILMAISSVLFMGSLIATLIAIQINPDLTYSIVDAGNIAQMEQMYRPDSHASNAENREADSDVLMFGYYIMNNTSIGLRTFASGLLFGIGSIFILLFNGLTIGTVAGHLTQLGYIETFWGFVSGHSAMELIAIIISGAAGLKLSAALLRPGQRSRLRALKENAKIALVMMYGAAAMFFIAAFIEAFWSPRTFIPINIKYAVGIFLWVIVIAYFCLAGRGKVLDET